MGQTDDPVALVPGSTGQIEAIIAMCRRRARLARAWQERGHRVTVERDTNLTPPRWILSDPPYLTGTHPHGSFFTLNVGEGLVYFDATSACVPGDILQLNARTPSP
ncbi:hypothetical protein [Microbacterium sp. Leaf203]|uniref:hypothetical protein n=1 Tax=Microbacterium sp. Leaf203 TaxID=1735677 RepID=UPI001F2AF891|nr:hypothetical protein [Microbacterium sp. Leaf203]